MLKIPVGNSSSDENFEDLVRSANCTAWVWGFFVDVMVALQTSVAGGILI